MKTKILAWIPTMIAIALLSYLTLQSPQETIQASGTIQRWLIFLFEKLPGGEAPAWVLDMHTVRSLAHIPEYFLLGCALFVGFKSVSTRAGFWSILAGGAIGMLDEVLKAVLPTRHFELRDWGLDLAGLAIAAVICVLFFYLLEKKKPKTVMTT